MKKEKSIHTVTYTCDPGREWLIDIVTDEEEKTYTAFLYHRNYGIKEMMYGVYMEKDSLEDFLLDIDMTVSDYIEQYVEDYMTE